MGGSRISNGHCGSFAEKGRDLDPHDLSPSCTPEVADLVMNRILFNVSQHAQKLSLAIHEVSKQRH